MVRGFDPAAFDIVREEFRDIDRRDLPERERERERVLPERERDEYDTLDDRVQSALETIMNDDSVILTPEVVQDINDPQVRMTRNGEVTRRTGRQVIRGSGQFSRNSIVPTLLKPKTRRRRRKSAYRRAYEAAFKSCKAKHMTKSGKWKKGGFRRCVSQSHKMAKKKAR